MRRVWPDAQVSALPLADGGEGTLDAVAACGGEIVTCEVAGPLGKRVAARMLVDGEHESAVIEMAEAAGIGYSPCTESAALAATTYGVGELMLRAVRAGRGPIYGLAAAPPTTVAPACCKRWARVLSMTVAAISLPVLRALSRWRALIWRQRCRLWMARVSWCFPMSKTRSWGVGAH